MRVEVLTILKCVCGGGGEGAKSDHPLKGWE